ncbi:substrate-binding domain-containing protein [Falsirhodobacter sp. alg1]|uniref:substrate-binding domain-containing protein n=1 Tax=Falsirhodobacter sp. alg1 TaxID=1472418 RepID=UPI0005EF0F04|nr:substrate-binding domain-containing protein [Falsirhodobacter sp. alg1]
MKAFTKINIGIAAALLASAPVLAAAETTIGVVVKQGGSPWFNAMEMGIDQEAEALGVNAFMVGPTSNDPALQVRAIEDLIARGVDVIGVVPNDAQVLEPVLERARAAGIKVITHESPDTVNNDYNFELVSTEDLGIAHGELFANATECKGSYAVYVGGLTVPAQNAWADAAVDYLTEHCPDMKQVSERFGVAESVDDSRNTTLDLIRAHPDLSGILAFGSQGPIGAARAVQERGLSGDVAVVGLFSAGQGRRLVHEGAITGGFVWSPLEAGKVFVQLGQMLVEGKEITDGEDLPLLGQIKLEGNNIYANKPLALTEESVDGLAELGL